MLEALVPDIQRTAELASEISAACREQSVGIEPINQAIQQLDQVTQSNAGAASQMSATAEQLSAEAGRLDERGKRRRRARDVHQAGPRDGAGQRRLRPRSGLRRLRDDERPPGPTHLPARARPGIAAAGFLHVPHGCVLAESRCQARLL